MDIMFSSALDKLKHSYKITIGFHAIKLAILAIFMIIDYGILKTETGILSTFMLIALFLTFCNVVLYATFFYMSINNA